MQKTAKSVHFYLKGIVPSRQVNNARKIVVWLLVTSKIGYVQLLKFKSFGKSSMSVNA